jgi:hypothetical protein
VRPTSLLAAFLTIIPYATLAGPITVERADHLLSRLPKDPWLATKDASALAWLEAPNLHALVDLFEATGQTRYLDELVRRSDQALSHRDDVRNFRDYSGKIRKAWSMAYKYTVGEATLTDGSGRGVIKLRSVPYSSNHLTEVSVTTSDAGRFTLRVTNAQWKREETFSDLSTDPADPRHFPKIINAPHTTPTPPAGTCTGHSLLLRAQPLADSVQPPNVQDVTMKPLPLSYGGYLGIIYHPMLRFAEIARENPDLKSYLPAADRYIKAADESYDDAQDLWRNGPADDEGYYLFCARGGAFPWDNLPEPFNYLGGHVAAQSLLYQFTGNPAHKDRIERMSRLFKRRLQPRDGDTYVWHYWYEPITTTGWTRADSPSDNVPEFKPAPNIEDVSHATHDMQLVLSAHALGIEFDDRDLRRFANTFLNNVVNKAGTGFNSAVDGSNKREALTRTKVFGWVPLAQVDPAVYHACRRIYEARDDDHLPSIARLLNWERKVARPPAGGNNGGN